MTDGLDDVIELNVGGHWATEDPASGCVVGESRSSELRFHEFPKHL